MWWINFTKLKGIKVQGNGVIDGRGSGWWFQDYPFIDGETKLIIPLHTSASEDSISNLAEAKIALEAGFRRGNAREKLGGGKVNKRREQATDNSDYVRNSHDHSDKQKPVMRSQEVSDSEDDSKLASLSASLSLLLLPSLKEVTPQRSKEEKL